MTNVTPRVSIKRTQCNHDPMFTNDGRCSKCHPGKRIIAVQHSDGTREIDPALMTTPEVLTGRAAAGLRNVAEMQREMGAAMKQAASIMENTMRSFEAYRSELTDDEIALMDARCDETDHAEEYSGATEGHW